MAAARRANPARSNKVNPSASRRSYSSCSNAKTHRTGKLEHLRETVGNARKMTQFGCENAFLSAQDEQPTHLVEARFQASVLHGLHLGRIATSRLRSAINRRSQDRSRRHILIWAIAEIESEPFSRPWVEPPNGIAQRLTTWPAASHDDRPITLRWPARRTVVRRIRNR